jgi:hypothetical protein
MLVEAVRVTVHRYTRDVFDMEDDAFIMAGGIIDQPQIVYEALSIKGDLDRHLTIATAKMWTCMHGDQFLICNSGYRAIGLVDDTFVVVSVQIYADDDWLLADSLLANSHYRQTLER